ncbi:MAG: hydrogenase maturation protease [Flavobacteriaceae bacterium]|nr:hydrogenase maturation protease [Flavobacteriaceae bacterium]
MRNLDNKILVLGIGNTGRQDDGLGWLFLDFLKSQKTSYVLEYRYQLQIEDAELISRYDEIIFVDATKEKTYDGFFLKPCQASDKYSFSTHALAPETILYLCNKLYGHDPQSTIFGIQGYEWELKIGISSKASHNLDEAKKYFIDKVLI